jgi:hypothetical protein
MKPKTILAVSSRGGHWTELLRLRPAFEGHQVIYVTTVPDYATMVDGADCRIVKEANRSQKLSLMILLAQMAWIVFRVRPDCVVTTGAAPGYFGIWLGRLTGARTLWIDSIANAEELSGSGKMAIGRADLVLTQWEHLCQPGRVEYHGGLL